MPSGVNITSGSTQCSVRLLARYSTRRSLPRPVSPRHTRVCACKALALQTRVHHGHMPIVSALPPLVAVAQGTNACAGGSIDSPGTCLACVCTQRPHLCVARCSGTFGTRIGQPINAGRDVGGWWRWCITLSGRSRLIPLLRHDVGGAGCALQMLGNFLVSESIRQCELAELHGLTELQ